MKYTLRFLLLITFLACHYAQAQAPTIGQWELRKRTATGMQSFGITGTDGTAIGFSGGNPALLTSLLGSTAASFVAGTNAQGQGLITTENVVITTAAANPSGVTLPVAQVGRAYHVINRGANPVNVYPSATYTIDGQAANAPVLLPVNGQATFRCHVAGSFLSTRTWSLADSTVTNAQLAGSIAAGKLIGTDISTLGTVTAGTWQGTAIGLGFGGTGATTALGARQNLLPAMAGNANRVLRVNAAATDYELATIAGGGDALVSSPLSQFAATTSAQLAGVLSDETGTGAAVYGTSPTITTATLNAPVLSLSTNAAFAAGTNAQGQGPITAENTVIATAAATPSGVTLPTATAGRVIHIHNVTANPVNVYPATGSAIDALAANAALSVPAGCATAFRAESATQWRSMVQLAPGTTSAQLASAITNETGTGVLVYNTNPSLSNPSLSWATITTAAAHTAGTNAQGQGLIGFEYTVITTASANPSGVTLPGIIVGRQAYLRNSSANPVNVYPSAGQSINGLAVNTPVSLAPGAELVFRATTATGWQTSLGIVPAANNTVPIASGGTGATTALGAYNSLCPATTKGDIVADDGTNNVRLPVGTNGQVLTADSTTATGLRWAAASGGSGGNWVLLNTITISGTPANVDVSITGAYRRYRIELENVAESGQNGFAIQTSSDGGTTFASGASDYGYASGPLGSYAPTRTGAASSILSRLQCKSCFGSIELVDPASTSFKKFMRTELWGENWNTTEPEIFIGTGYRNSTAAINAIRLSPASGTWSAGGKVRLFGWIE